MNRRLLLLLAPWIVACSGPSQPLEDRIPVQADSWTRTEVKPLAPGDVPDIVRQLQLRNAVSATYTGPAPITVRVFEMSVPTSAFELIQKWRQQDGLAVYSGPFFIVADPAAGPSAPGLLEALRKQLK